MQIFTAKDLQGFELEVARYLAKLPISGYTLLGFKFFNQELFEINGLIISDEGIVCCLEISDRDGIWLGTTDGAWTTGTGEINCSLANNPWKQVNYYVLYIKNLLWAKLNKSTFVNGLIVISNETQIRIPNIAVDNFNRNNPLTVCHFSKLEMVLNQMQSLFKLPYEQGRAGRWIYALTGSTEAGLLENSTLVENSITKVQQDVQRAIGHNTDLTEQILNELINFNSNMQKVFSGNADLIERFLNELASFKHDIHSQTSDFTNQSSSELNSFKQEIKDQNAYLAGRLFTELSNFQQKTQDQNSDVIRQFSTEITNFKQETKSQNIDFANQVNAELARSKQTIQQDLKQLTELNSNLVNQVNKIESLLTAPKGLQKLWLLFKPKKKR